MKEKKPNKPTFKFHARETGLRGVGNPFRSIDIKVKRRTCGTIIAPNWQTPDNLYRVRFMIQKSLGWEWITLKYKHEDPDVVKDWLIANWEKIEERYTFHFDD